MSLRESIGKSCSRHLETALSTIILCIMWFLYANYKQLAAFYKRLLENKLVLAKTILQENRRKLETVIDKIHDQVSSIGQKDFSYECAFLKLT